MVDIFMPKNIQNGPKPIKKPQKTPKTIRDLVAPPFEKKSQQAFSINSIHKMT